MMIVPLLVPGPNFPSSLTPKGSHTDNNFTSSADVFSLPGRLAFKDGDERRIGLNNWTASSRGLS